MSEVKWVEGEPSKEGLYWVHDSINGVLFAMVVAIDESEFGSNMYYYIMGCDLGFPVSQLTHYSSVTPPEPPVGTGQVLDIGEMEEQNENQS